MPLLFYGCSTDASQSRGAIRVGLLFGLLTCQDPNATKKKKKKKKKKEEKNKKEKKKEEERRMRRRKNKGDDDDDDIDTSAEKNRVAFISEVGETSRVYRLIALNVRVRS